MKTSTISKKLNSLISNSHTITPLDLEQTYGLTEGDLKRAEPSTLSDTQEQFAAVMEGTQVNRIMIQNLITTTPDAPVIDAARTLFKSKYGALPVLEGGKLVGILTDNDLIGTLVKLLDREP